MDADAPQPGALDQLLSGFEDGTEVQERDLEFTLDPARAREALRGMVKADPMLWLKHLGQLLYDVELEEPLRITFFSGDIVRLEFVPVSGEMSNQFLPDQVQVAAGRLMSPALASRMARVLCESPKPVLYRHASQPETSLRVSPEAFKAVEGEPDGLSKRHVPGKPVRGVLIEAVTTSVLPRELAWIGAKASLVLQPEPKSLSGLGAVTARKILLSVFGLQPNPPVMHEVAPLKPEWPFPPPMTDDDHFPALWDWESVEEASVDGFAWTVEGWGELCESHAPLDLDVYRNPISRNRTYSEYPILGCYTSVLGGRISLDLEREHSAIDVLASRVFGVSWTIGAPQPAVLIPIIQGVPGLPIPLEGYPAGLFVLADASRMRCDATGLALVENEEYAAWVEEHDAWAHHQASRYLAYLPDVPRIWTTRVSRREQLDRPPTITSRAWRAALKGLYAVGPVRKMLKRREEALARWIERRDP